MTQVALASEAADMYVALLKRCLTRQGFAEPLDLVEPSPRTLKGRIYAPIGWALHRRNLVLAKRVPEARRDSGLIWPAQAETMLSNERLDNIVDCVRTVIAEGVPGDLMETGVWRGGATILMRGAAKAYGDDTRRVWVADSFQGLPKPNAHVYPADAGDDHWKWPQLAVSVDDVRDNFRRYGLLDDQVQFLVGWFKDTLPAAPVDMLAVLRIDADMYESTADALRYMYPTVVPGGFVIIDDYHLPGCRQAVNDYRAEHGITDEIIEVDWTGIFWRRTRHRSAST